MKAKGEDASRSWSADNNELDSRLAKNSLFVHSKRFWISDWHIITNLGGRPPCLANRLDQYILVFRLVRHLAGLTLDGISYCSRIGNGKLSSAGSYTHLAKHSRRVKHRSLPVLNDKKLAESGKRGR